MHPKQSPGIMLVTMESSVRQERLTQPISVLIQTIQRHRSCGERHSAQLSSMYGYASRSLNTHVVSAHLDVVRHHTTHTCVSHNEHLYTGLHTNTVKTLALVWNQQHESTCCRRNGGTMRLSTTRQTWRKPMLAGSSSSLIQLEHNTQGLGRKSHDLVAIDTHEFR